MVLRPTGEKPGVPKVITTLSPAPALLAGWGGGVLHQDPSSRQLPTVTQVAVSPTFISKL